MSLELNLRFPDTSTVIVRLGTTDDGSGPLKFENPITESDLRDLEWYLETYGARSLSDPDDEEAQRIAAQLPEWGKALFNAVFNERESQRRLNEFQDEESENRLLTISADHPTILSLPWELLHDPTGGFLFMEHPRISIRRRVAGSMAGRQPFRITPKGTLHLLFVVSRPRETGFLDPRADALAVLDALDEYAPGRVKVEFLRRAMLDALINRLEDSSLPAVDILHFDGHGIFDGEGDLPNRVEKARANRVARTDELLRETNRRPAGGEFPPNTGYLLFEDEEGNPDFVSAEKLGANLHRHRVALVILSACQSAAVQDIGNAADSHPMGSVAARLTATGIPSVLAMTHSVLVHTTRALFGEFYKELARHKTIGESLDNARRYLANHPEKYEIQRGPIRVPLRLFDWFLPALYQPGADGPLLLEAPPGEDPPAAPRTNLEKRPEAGFFGRRRELWSIERSFAERTRRITITGFGGQGKTALAQEAGRWLTRIRFFDAAVFVDYSRVQGDDPVAVAVSFIGSVLGESFPNPGDVTHALKQTAVLVILDNLEALSSTALHALLDAAVEWSEAGGSRVLCTTRRPDFGHAEYRVSGTHVHQRIVLDGLGSRDAPDDAVEWFATLMNLPPAPTIAPPRREELTALFDQVGFHPLSIRVLAQQLKTRPPAALGARLEQLLALSSADNKVTEDTPASLLASIQLSLDQLDDAAREALPRLGVFQGGAFEDDLIAITGLGNPGIDVLRKILSLRNANDLTPVGQVDAPSTHEWVEDELLKARLPLLPPTLWPSLRHQLEAAALIQPLFVADVAVPFLRFHPTLAPMLRAQLSAEDREHLEAAHRLRYYGLSAGLYSADSNNPTRTRSIAWMELPNLLHAAHNALDARAPYAVDFSDNIRHFVGRIFGLQNETEGLARKAETMSRQVGTHSWFVFEATRAEDFFRAGRVGEAIRVAESTLAQLGDAATYQRGQTLSQLATYLVFGSRLESAAKRIREALELCDHLEQTGSSKRLRGGLLTKYADLLVSQRRYSEAEPVYQAALAIHQGNDDKPAQAAVLGQLGSLAMNVGDLSEAVARLRDALELFRQIREPAMEAVAHHQLGVTLQTGEAWEEAEIHYREAARIKEHNGWITGSHGAASTWYQLGVLNKEMGKPDSAEAWYRKAIVAYRNAGDQPYSLTVCLRQMAKLLRTEKSRLDEARRFAEEALAVMQTIDPAAANAWLTYDLLAEIDDDEMRVAQTGQRLSELQARARGYRRLAREARRDDPGSRQELKNRVAMIRNAISWLSSEKEDPEHEQTLRGWEEHGWGPFVAALRRIKAGERDTEELCASVDSEDALLIETILLGLADPSAIEKMLAPDEPQA